MFIHQQPEDHKVDGKENASAHKINCCFINSCLKALIQVLEIQHKAMWIKRACNLVAKAVTV